MSSSPVLPSSLSISSSFYLFANPILHTSPSKSRQTPEGRDCLSVCTEHCMILTGATGAHRLNFIHKILPKGMSIFEGTKILPSDPGGEQTRDIFVWGFFVCLGGCFVIFWWWLFAFLLVLLCFCLFVLFFCGWLVGYFFPQKNCQVRAELYQCYFILPHQHRNQVTLGLLPGSSDIEFWGLLLILFSDLNCVI